MKDIHPIRTQADYRRALKRIDALIDAKPGTPDDDELEVWSVLVASYEEQHVPFPAPSPLAAIKFRMEQADISQSDLAQLLGSKSRASEVLRGERPLTKKMIAILHSKLGIPLESLLGDYLREVRKSIKKAAPKPRRAPARRA